jgi:hypothetical protein
VLLLQVQQAPVLEFLMPTDSTIQVRKGICLVLTDFVWSMTIWRSGLGPLHVLDPSLSLIRVLYNPSCLDTHAPQQQHQLQHNPSFQVLQPDG